MTNLLDYEKALCPMCGEITAKKYKNGYFFCCSNNPWTRCKFWGTAEDAVNMQKSLKRIKKIK